MNPILQIKIALAVYLLKLKAGKVERQEMKKRKLDEIITSGNNVYVKVMG